MAGGSYYRTDINNVIDVGVLCFLVRDEQVPNQRRGHARGKKAFVWHDLLIRRYR
jgi:hypothetical protein